MAGTEKAQDIYQETSATPGSDVEVGKNLKPIDTIHGDEAVTVLAGYGGEQTWTDQEETQVRRKIDLRLMPILCITYGLQYYDKAMLSQAVSVLTVLYFELEANINMCRLCSD